MVHLTQVDKVLGKKSVVVEAQGIYDGGQLNPLGGCILEAERPPLRREEVRLGTWNVTGMGNREAELLDALITYKLDVLGVSETWMKKGASVEIPGYRWVGMAGDNESGKGGGVGFLVKDSIWSLVGEVVEVNSRVISVSLKVGGRDCWLFQIYAPINDAEREVRERFWAQLRDVVEIRRRKAAVIIMGDVNGRVGSRAEDIDIVGRYGEEVVNENGESCLELCRGSDLLVLNGWFPHKKVHKMTYVQRMLDGTDREAILDYFCVSKELKTSAIDVKVRRGVEIGSNHHLVVLKLDKSKVDQKRKGWNRCKWRVCLEKLKKQEGQQAYVTKLQEKWVEQEYGTVEEEWLALKKWLLDAVEEAVGKKKCGGKGKSWWGEEISHLVQRKKAAYKKWLNSKNEDDRKAFREVCKSVKEAVKEAKQRAWETFGKEIQEDFYNNSRLFWKKVKGEQQREHVVLKNGAGQIIEGDEKTAEWCKEYFEKLYNEGFSDQRHAGSYDIVERWQAPRDVENEDNIAEQEPTRGEVRKGLKRLKSGKAAGSSGIVAEMLIAGGVLV